MEKTLILHDNEYKSYVEKTNDEFIMQIKETVINANSPYIITESSTYDSNISSKGFQSFIYNSANGWLSKNDASSIYGQWLSIDLLKRTKVNYFSLRANVPAYTQALPKNFILQGSNDGLVFIDIKEFNFNWTSENATLEKFFDIPLSAYRHYRIYVKSVGTASYVSISYLKFYLKTEDLPARWKTVSNSLPSAEQIYIDGVNLDSNILNRNTVTLSPIPMLDKNDISLNNGNPCFSKVISLTHYLDIRILTTDVAGQIKLSEVGNYDNLIDFTSINDIYDNFTDGLEVILIPSENQTQAHITLTANWSPIDELEGDFEVVTWTDEENVSKKLELNTIPSPQFIHTTTLSNVTGELKNVISSDLSVTTNSNVRYLLTKDNVNWLKWNGSDFTIVSFTDKKDILNMGMTYNEITLISDWSKWSNNKINIGVYLQDNNTTTSKVGSLGFIENSPINSSTLSNVNFYILNTTAKIELDLQGLLLSGHLSDLDSTRVQYKVTLNGQPYYPASGGYTSLSPSPQNIDITFKSSEIKMNDWNTLRVDFKDFFGTEDYWQTTFVGNYSALMFMDVDGNYYSDDIGKVLQYLDFGTIVAGEVTVAHEVIIKNQYGYAVKDLQLEASRSNLPEGVDIQLSKINDPFEPEQNLLFEDGLNYEDQTSFYVRMVTDVDSIPNDTKSFNIFVKASRKGV